jgi:hypothetical protein
VAAVRCGNVNRVRGSSASPSRGQDEASGRSGLPPFMPGHDRR